MARKRGKARHHIPKHSLVEVAGGAAIAGGLLFLPPKPGWDPSLVAIIDFKGKGERDAGIYNLEQSIPLYGTDPNMSGNRALVGIGAGTVVLAHLLPKLLHMRKKRGWKLL